MSNLTEDFIREQIRKLLSEDSGDSDEKPKKKNSGANRNSAFQVFGGPGGGNWSKDLRAVFQSEDGMKEDRRLAVKNPARLMKNLGIPRITADNDKAKVEQLLNQALRGASAMRQAFDDVNEQDDGKSRWGFLVTTTLNTRDGALFIFDTIRGAINSEYLTLDDQIRVDKTNQGILVYHIKNDVRSGGKAERWGQ
jgi:hypothetical protein